VVIGLCGRGFPEVRRALQNALPEIEIVDVPVGGTDKATVPAVDVLVPLVAEVDATLLDAARPRLVQQFGVGLQGVDLLAARERGVPVANVPAADTGNATAVAEITLLHILALLRRYHQAQRSIADRRVGQPCGSTLAGKTVTVVGVGAIGAAVIARLNAFGAIALGVGRREYQADSTLAGLLPPQRYYPIEQLDMALARTDVVVLCLPLTEQTRGLVGRGQLAAMPRGGYLVNVGRGPVADRAALLHALREGHLAGAGIDVAWEEPIDPGDELLRENVTVTPHIGGVTVESYAAMAATFAANVRNLRTGAPLRHRAD
jgi:phosphoglycerate dehydrogenase-like enzyme